MNSGRKNGEFLVGKLKLVTVFMPWYRMDSPPPDFVLLNSVLKNGGINISFYDINKDMFLKKFKDRVLWKYLLLSPEYKVVKDFWTRNFQDFKNYAKEILNNNPDVVIFKLAPNNFELSKEMSRLIKKISPNTFIILAAFKFPKLDLVKALMGDSLYYGPDILIHGEDEIVIYDILKALKNKNWEGFNKKYFRSGKVVDTYANMNILDDLDKLPFYDFSEYDLNDFRYQDRLEIYSSRGCLFNCVFCRVWQEEKHYRAMSGDRLFAEFEFQKKTFPYLKHIRLVDKLINGRLDQLEKFCKLLVKNFNSNEIIDWSGDAIISKNMDLSFLKLMRQAGCVGLGYGIESGSDNVLRAMKKPFNVSIAEKVIMATKIANIFTTVNIIVGFPTETEEDFRKTLDFIKRNREYIDEVRLAYSMLKIDMYSPIYCNPEEFGIKPQNEENWYRDDNWTSCDGKNTYKVRLERAQRLVQMSLDMGMKVTYNSREIKTVKKVN